MKKTLNIDAKLLAEAKAACGAPSDRETVRLGLEALVRHTSYQRLCEFGGTEPSDALVEFERTREQRTEQGELVRALTETVQLSEARYKGGLDSYLQVLDAQRNLFAGELTLAQLQFRERGAVLQLYRALGGGWQ
jgi:hypothetical protein